MNITNRGKVWEWVNSLWLIWTWIPFLGFISFIWIGARAQYSKWTFLGCLHFLPWYVYWTLNGLMQRYRFVNTLAVLMLLTFWISAIVWGITARKEYLIRREALVNTKEGKLHQIRQAMAGQYARADYPRSPSGQDPTMASNYAAYMDASGNPAPPPVADNPLPSSGVQIQVNRYTVQQLAALPGMSLVQAQNAITVRTQMGRFLTFDDFVAAAGLHPYYAAQLRPYVVL